MLRKLNKKRDQQGFTLIELMIVIAIIGILAAIAIPQFTAYRERAHRAATISDVKNAYTAVQAYLADNPNTAPDAVPDDTIGPEEVGTEYTGLRTSAGVTIAIAGGNVTGTNTNLDGSYVMDIETGAVTDTLGEADEG